MKETKPYSERTATVVGAEGALGSRVKTNLQGLGFASVLSCEKDDTFVDFVNGSTDIFFAVNNDEIAKMVAAGKDFFTPQHAILDGSSVKGQLISSYRHLDEQRISVCSTHIGAVPTQPLRGIKVWLCKVGPNSETALNLAMDMYLSTNSSLQIIDIGDHNNVERDQWITMVTSHIVASTLRQMDFPLEKFDQFATLNSELLAQPVGRTLGQGVNVPSEVIFSQTEKHRFFKALSESLKDISKVLDDHDALKKLMQTNIDFHDTPQGFVQEIFKRAGVIGARNANLRMHSLSFRITDDQPGKLINVLEPFRTEGANITALDSMPGTITDDERAQGVNPDKIVDFDCGIDPKTISRESEARIKERLQELGCTITAK